MLRELAVRARVRLALAASCAAAIPALCLGADTAMPERKPGWWEMNVTVAGPTPQPIHQTVHICTDAAVDQVQTPVGIHTGKQCPPVQAARTPDGWTFQATCVLGRTTISTQGRASGDFGSRYHVDLTTRLNPPPMPQVAEVRSAIDATWLGACPAGKKPGDMDTSVQTNVAPNAH